MDVKFEILENIGIIKEIGSWRLEVNEISWNDKPAVIDIRKWNADHTACSKGITFSAEEFEKLKTLEI